MTAEQTGSRPSLGEIMNQLTDLAEQTNAQEQAAPANETLADDVALPKEREELILREEAVVRRALGLFGINYDELILPEGNSVYAMAVQANPQIVQSVMEAESPVLAALEVAANFKPYADFMTKYGQEPDQIREAIRNEVANEMKSKGKEKEESEAVSTPFSTQSREAKPGKNLNGPTALADIFNQ